MVDQDIEYNTDTISLTSTVESQNDGIYEIECILSERWSEATKVKEFLIEWEGYPMHACTWEPEDGLLPTGLLRPWAKKKSRMGKSVFNKYIAQNEKLFEDAKQQHQDRKTLRKQKRAKRRNKLRECNGRCLNDDNSEDDTPLMQQRRPPNQAKEKTTEHVPHSQETYNSLFVDSQDPDPLGPPPSLGQSEIGSSIGQRPVHRKAPLEQSTDDEENTSSSEDSADSLMGEMADKAQKTQRNIRRQTISRSQVNKEMNLGNPILSPNSPQQKVKSPPAKPATTPATTKAQDQGQSHIQRPKPQRTLTVPVSSTIPGSTEVKGKERCPSELAAQVLLPVSAKDANALAPKISNSKTAVASTPVLAKSVASNNIQKQPGSVDSPVSRKNGTASKTSNPIRLTNEPKVALRKQWDTEGLYGKIKFRGIAEHRSRREGTPDVNVLEFVGPAPSILAKSRRSYHDDDPYARRETRVRRIQDVDPIGNSRRGSLEEHVPVEKRYPGKVPLICARDRLSRDCPFGPEKCRFIHDDDSSLPVGDMNGYVPPKYRTPPITCPFWLRERFGCRKPDDQCGFAHRNTGWIPSTTKNAQPLPCNPDEKPLREQLVSRILTDNNTAPTSEQTSSRYPYANNAGAPGKPEYTKRVGKTCWYWANITCEKPDELCKFKHYHTGEIAQLPNCKFWEKGRCAFTAEQCKYSHGEPKPSGVSQNATMPTPKVPRQLPDTLISSTEHEILADSYMHDAVSPVVGTTDSPALPLEQSRLPRPVSIPTSVSTTRPPAAVSNLKMRQYLERALGTGLNDLFDWGNDGNGAILLHRQAFLIYHPQDHQEELEYITRWLLQHDVEVSNVWFESSWDRYAQHVIKTGSGVVLVHPDFDYFPELKDFGKVLLEQVRVWSVGVQEGIEYDSALSHQPSNKEYHCIELFPTGGFIYITDDVFEVKPRLALDIIKLFLAKIERLRPGKGSESPRQEIDNINLHWRLCVRPELMEYLFDKCEEQGKALDAGDPDATARAELYTLLSDTNYIEQDSPVVPLSLKADKFPIMSERGEVAKVEPVDYFNALARSREKANLRMIRYYAGLHVDTRRDYRHFYIVHTDRSGPCVQQWQREVQTLTDIMTPEQCIQELSKDEGDQNDQKFDFYERYLLEAE